MKNVKSLLLRTFTFQYLTFYDSNNRQRKVNENELTIDYYNLKNF